MRRLLTYLAISVGLLAILGMGYIGYLRYQNYVNCPTTERPTPLAFPQYPQITRTITDVMEPYFYGETGQQIFLTIDTPETVVAFYRTTLRAQGWREVGRGIDERGYQYVEFRETRFLPSYYLKLHTNVVQGNTTVEVLRSSDSSPCIAY